MKIGVKTFDDEKILKFFENKVDFFEIMAVQKNNYSFLKNFSLPIVIHAEHAHFGINPADKAKKEQNLKSINFAREIADLVNSEKIILHSGAIEQGNAYCSEENAINFFKELNDSRILTENLWNTNFYSKRLCQTSNEVKSFIEKTNSGFCFDINHAILSLDKFKDYDFLKEYIKLNPIHYHLGGQKIKEKLDHLYFQDSNLDLKKIFEIFPKNAEITLETGTDIKKIENDVKIIKNVLESIQ